MTHIPADDLDPRQVTGVTVVVTSSPPTLTSHPAFRPKAVAVITSRHSRSDITLHPQHTLDSEALYNVYSTTN